MDQRERERWFQRANGSFGVICWPCASVERTLHSSSVWGSSDKSCEADVAHHGDVSHQSGRHEHFRSLFVPQNDPNHKNWCATFVAIDIAWCYCLLSGSNSYIWWQLFYIIEINCRLRIEIQDSIHGARILTYKTCLFHFCPSNTGCKSNSRKHVYFISAPLTMVVSRIAETLYISICDMCKKYNSLTHY